ncbi:DUF4097 family beta strand repeat-containing protein [Sporosarcina obsidiansis]|uniref:DUF4097 family beta strand repeat-containing protein n=1 Tax=Sporosarcina obsidiansis TaxID=2660748 RepID=UPI00129B52C1|nr:DUF4097 family beta strand repeat-containing protein [Sporosarcina obsidiansis]
MKRNTFSIVLIIIGAMWTSGCSNDTASEDVQSTSIKDIETIHIDYGSTNVMLYSTNETELVTSLRLFDNGPGLVMDKGKKEVKLRLKSDVKRLVKIGRMPQLAISIPTAFTGDLVLKGSSGNIIGEDLELHQLEVHGSSGNVELDFKTFHSDIVVNLTSGNIHVQVNDEQLDATVLLQSKSGRHSNEWKLDHHKQSKKTTSGTIGSGKYTVELKTTSGNIKLE